MFDPAPLFYWLHHALHPTSVQGLHALSQKAVLEVITASSNPLTCLRTLFTLCFDPQQLHSSASTTTSSKFLVERTVTECRPLPLQAEGFDRRGVLGFGGGSAAASSHGPGPPPRGWLQGPAGGSPAPSVGHLALGDHAFRGQSLPSHPYTISACEFAAMLLWGL